MINFMYDADVALQNYTYETYQPPVKSFDEKVATTKGYLPPNLGNTIITPEMIPMGSVQLELEPAVNQLYEQIYLEITGGA